MFLNRESRTMKVSKNSFWDQLYCFPDIYQHEKTNICKYARGVLRGIIAAMAFVVGGVLGSMFILYPYFVFILYGLTGYYEPELAWRDDQVVFGASLVVQFLVLCVVLVAVFHDHVLIPYRCSRSGKPAKPPSFLTLWYRSVKEKTCFLIERE